MARKKRITWTWQPDKGLLAWEYTRAGVVLASSDGPRPVGEALAALMDVVSDLDDGGQERKRTASWKNGWTWRGGCATRWILWSGRPLKRRAMNGGRPRPRKNDVLP